MQRQHSHISKNQIIRNQYNTMNNYQVMTPQNTPLISINIGQVSSATNNEPRNQSYKPPQITQQTSQTYVCISCGSKHTRQHLCCNNTTIKLTSIFTGSALDDTDFTLSDLFKRQRISLFNQVPLNNGCLSDAINNQQRIKLYSLKKYYITGTGNRQSTKCYNLTTPLTDCIYILIPFSLPRLYIPNYGVIQLDARNSFTLPTRELVTINNDTKKIVI